MAEYRVLIVGGSTTGLVLAHALSHFNIDYLILEKGKEVNFQGGMGIVLQANGLRLLDQLGLYDDVVKRGTVVERMNYRWGNTGSSFWNPNFPQRLGKISGYKMAILDRQTLLQSLYDALPDKTKMLTNKKCIGVEYGEHGVTVSTEDGSTYKGNIVVGADGVHSFVRTSLLEKSEIKGTDAAKKMTEKDKFKCDYYGITGWSKIGYIPDFAIGTANVTYEKNRNTFFIPEEDGHVRWIAYFKHDKQYTEPDIPRLTEHTLKETISKNADMKVTESMTFGEFCERPATMAIVELEEGIVERFHRGRAFLMGDAVAKSTPNLGQGGNYAIESVAAFINELLAASRKAGSLSALTTKDYHDIGTRAQERVFDRLKASVTASGMAARWETMQSPLRVFIGAYFPRMTGAEFNVTMGALGLGKAQSFEDIEYKGRDGVIPWTEWEPKYGDWHLGNLHTALPIALVAFMFLVSSGPEFIRTAFDAVWTGNPCSCPGGWTPVTDPMGLIYPFMNQLGIGTLLAAEVLRAVNTKNAITSAIAAMTLAPYRYIGGYTSLLSIAHVIFDNSTGPKDPRSRLVAMRHSACFRQGVLLSVLIPGLLIANSALQLFQVDRSNDILYFLFQRGPFLPLAMTAALAQLSPTGREAAKKKLRGFADVPGLMKGFVAYSCLALISYIIHGAYALRSRPSLAFGHGEDSSFMVKFGLHLAGVNGVPRTMQNQYILNIALASLAAYVCTIRVLNREWHNLKCGGIIRTVISIASLVGGIGMPLGILWCWREVHLRAMDDEWQKKTETRVTEEEKHKA